MTSGERRVASRLESFLNDDCLVWYDIPVGRKNRHPDFVIIDPENLTGISGGQGLDGFHAAPGKSGAGHAGNRRSSEIRNQSAGTGSSLCL